MLLLLLLLGGGQVSKVCGTGTSTSKSLEFLQLQEETIKTILAVR